jgi:hypothetical protein
MNQKSSPRILILENQADRFNGNGGIAMEYREDLSNKGQEGWFEGDGEKGGVYCPTYGPGTLTEVEDEMNATRDRLFEERFFCGC